MPHDILLTLTRARTLTTTSADSGDKLAGQRASAAMVRTRPRIVCGGLEGLKNAARGESRSEQGNRREARQGVMTASPAPVWGVGVVEM
jgi:hypothetical protein